MKRIAIIIQGSLSNRRGLMNASLNRIHYLNELGKYDIDVFCIQSKPSFLFQLFKGVKNKTTNDEQYYEGKLIRVLTSTWYLFDYLLYVKLGLSKFFAKNELDKYIYLFEGYDLISAHSISPAILANKISQRYNCPFCVTWHGSDIHTNPFKNRYLKKKTTECLESAYYNFFVSKALMKTSKLLTQNAKSIVLHNGIGEHFHGYDKQKLLTLKKKYQIVDTKVVAFVGNLIKIKNVMVLPEIFNSVQEKYDGELVFWIIGDGKLKKKLQDSLDAFDIKYKMFGNRPCNEMPDIMNCIDVLALPSINEGLPLVTLEALSCNANVVGSDVGGIPEVIGIDNVVPFGKDFVENFSLKIVNYLHNPRKQVNIDEFSWSSVAKLESEIYDSIWDSQ